MHHRLARLAVFAPPCEVLGQAARPAIVPQRDEISQEAKGKSGNPLARASLSNSLRILLSLSYSLYSQYYSA